MHRFEAELAPGRKRPYDTWTFLLIPRRVVEAIGKPPLDVRGTLAGVAFRGRVSRGEGMLRMPVPKPLRDAAGVANGERVRVALEVDPEPREVEVPAELAALLAADDELARRFGKLAPSCRRAWAEYVGGAKRPQTRERRVGQARDGIRARRFPGQR